jgi:predicted nucleic acid-binding protein
MNFVLDTSIAVSWCFSDEATPKSILLLKRLEKETAFVPNLWSLELGNVLVMAEKRKRITFAQSIEFISLLSNLKIEVDSETNTKALHEIFSLAHSENLTTYDAAYLELAMRLGLPLATKDKELHKIAIKLGVITLG